nr:tape measure protein [uncultured Bacteroides sp.]
MKDNGVTSSVARLQTNLDKAQKSTVGLASSMRNSLGNAIMSLPGAQFFTNPIVAIGAGIGVISKLGMENDQTAISFDVLLGSQQKAAALMKEMKGYANTTPYESEDIFQNAKTMLGFGISLKSVMPNMKMLGDMAMGNKDKLNSLTLAFSQVTSAGKLQGQDLLQLINAGYNPLQDIAALTGKSMAKLKDEMSKGKISSDMVTEAFRHATSQGGRFYDMTNKIGQRAGGKLSTLFDSMKEKMLILYQAIAPILIPAIDMLGIAFDAITGPLQWLVNSFNSFIGLLTSGNPFIWAGVAAVVGFTIAANAMNIAMGILTGIVKAYVTIQKVLNFLFIANPIGLVVAAIAALTVGIVLAWNKFSGFRAFILTMWDTIKGFGNVLKDYVIDRITGLIKGIGLLGSAISKMFKGDWSGAWEDAKKGASGVLGIDAAQKAIQSSKNVVGKFSANYDYQKRQQAAVQKVKEGIKTPGVAGAKSGATITGSGDGSTGNGKSSTESAVTGGTKNNVITVNVGKFFENLSVNMMDKTNTRELEKVVIECMTRSLEIATSSAR